VIPNLPLLQWFRLIVEQRPDNGENVSDLNDINDIRNGVFSSALIHAAFDLRDIVILKVRCACLTYLCSCCLTSLDSKSDSRD
jgi:hypothetical protein